MMPRDSQKLNPQTDAVSISRVLFISAKDVELVIYLQC